jgi:chromosome segregation ATPase
MQTVKTELAQKLEEEQLKAKALEQEKITMENQVKSLTDQIAQVNQKLTDLQNTHATTVSHLQAMREEYVKLTDQKTALEAKLHDLKALREQVVVVKQELHEKKVEERKRLDRAEFAMGNHGYLMKEGTWAVARTPGKYPLNQEMYRNQ